MKTILIAYGVAFLVMAAGDALWVGVLMIDQYRKWIGPAMLDKPLLLPVICFYLLYPVGVTIFAVLPALDGGSVMRAAGMAALLGLVAYGTYDLTNYATLKGWSPVATVVDMAWGAFLSGVVAAAAFLAAQAWGAKA